MSAELSHTVARTADAAELHAPVPTLLLELQHLLGTLSATVAAETNRGRKPFRPGPNWPHQLGDLAYGVYLLADQTGVNVEEAVGMTAQRVSGSTPQMQAPPQMQPGSASGDGFFERNG